MLTIELLTAFTHANHKYKCVPCTCTTTNMAELDLLVLKVHTNWFKVLRYCIKFSKSSFWYKKHILQIVLTGYNLFCFFNIVDYLDTKYYWSYLSQLMNKTSSLGFWSWNRRKKAQINFQTDANRKNCICSFSH